MNCAKAVSRLPLLAGGELPPRRARTLERHLRDCPVCRAELEAYRTSETRIREAIVSGPAPDWTDGEWQALMKAVASKAGERRAPRAAHSFRPAFAYALAFVLVVAGTRIVLERMVREAAPPSVSGVLAERSSPLPVSVEGGEPDVRPTDRVLTARVEGTAPRLSAPSQESARRDVPALTWVSRETSLTIVWFINDNVKLED
jgi:hypothetical protein